MCLVVDRSCSNSLLRLLIFASMAGFSVVPMRSFRSVSVQKVGKSSSGKNLTYLNGLAHNLYRVRRSLLFEWIVHSNICLQFGAT